MFVLNRFYVVQPMSWRGCILWVNDLCHLVRQKYKSMHMVFAFTVSNLKMSSCISKNTQINAMYQSPISICPSIASWCALSERIAQVCEIIAFKSIKANTQILCWIICGSFRTQMGGGVCTSVTSPPSYLARPMAALVDYSRAYINNKAARWMPVNK